MKEFYDILSKVLPSLTTGIFGFLLAKFNYNKNQPLEKLEKAYNLIYYPLYELVHSYNSYKDIVFEEFIPECEEIICQNKIFIDRTTLRTLEDLKIAIAENSNVKDSYLLFQENVINKNSKLRSRLGYLEPGFIESFRYLAFNKKVSVVLILSFAAVYISAVAFSTFYVFNIQWINLVSVFLFLVGLVGTTVCLLLLCGLFISKKIKKVYLKWKKKREASSEADDTEE